MDSGQYDEQGRKLFLNGLYEEALDTFREGLRRFPGDEDLTLGVGMCQVRLGNVVSALEALEPLRTRRPDWGDPFLGVTDAYLKLGRLADAREAAESATAKQDDPEFIHEIARLFFDHRRFEEAAHLYRRAIGLGQKFAPAHLGLGACLHRLGRLDEADAEMREAIRLAADYWAAYQYLGNLLYERGRRKQAKEMLDKVPLDMPWHRLALERLVRMSWRKEDRPKRKLMERMLETAPPPPAKRHGLEAFLTELGQKWDTAAPPPPPRLFWTPDASVAVAAAAVAEVNGALGRIFEAPCSFEGPDRPALQRLDKHLAERLFERLAEFLEAYPWGNDEGRTGRLEFSGARVLCLYAVEVLRQGAARLNLKMVPGRTRARLESAAVRLTQECADRPQLRDSFGQLAAALRALG
ncbi:MAG: tetratricopeptide repeat protein [Elusimicrobia bacterium]|nr:tetratricopeptide repeat protein [Elusimicrobiota bacterium]